MADYVTKREHKPRLCWYPAAQLWVVMYPRGAFWSERIVFIGIEFRLNHLNGKVGRMAKGMPRLRDQYRAQFDPNCYLYPWE
jgi:hypothetical protein